MVTETTGIKPLTTRDRDMKLFRVCALLVLVGAVSCKNDTTGSVSVLPPLAGLRYVNISPDTTALDFRIVDAVAYAPNQTAATFRSGGLVDGISTGGALPYYAPVVAGSHQIRVFLDGTHGRGGVDHSSWTRSYSSRSASTTRSICRDSRVRLLRRPFERWSRLTPCRRSPPARSPSASSTSPMTSTTGALGPGGVPAAGTALDGRVSLTTAPVPAAATTGLVGLGFGNFSGYVVLDTSTATTGYRS